jgi:polyisoprenoid-binding protein YceI
MKKMITGTALAVLVAVVVPQTAMAADYKIDPAHSFVSFRIQHLGYSWLMGRFNDVTGEFSYDSSNPSASKIAIQVKAVSVDTNHAERDYHLRSADFLDVRKYPIATFKSTNYVGSDSSGTLNGVLTIREISKPVSIAVQKIGEGKDPWGGYRAGFSGTMKLTRKDFGGNYNLGPTSETMELQLTVEGIREK